jgi:hypothetical protein
MKNRANIVACALVLGAFAAPVAQAAATRSPGSGSHAAPAQRFNAFANLGREGSGLAGHERHAQQRKAAPAFNVFANLGHEGSGLPVVPVVVIARPWAT